MKDGDFDDFAEVWSAAYEAVSRGKTPSAGATNIAYEALREYPLDQITQALTRHVRSPDAGRFGLVPADVVLQIDGPTPNADQIIAEAMEPRTALAVLCRIEIGSWNLGSWDSVRLRPLAERCIARLPEWRRRIAAGELDDHERRAIERHGADLRNARLAAGGQGAGQRSLPCQ